MRKTAKFKLKYFPEPPPLKLTTHLPLRLYLGVSLSLWLVSMVLPAIYGHREGYEGELVIWGIELLFELPFAWLVQPSGWAVYANIFYLVAWARLGFAYPARSEIGTEIVMMLLFASCMFTMESLPVWQWWQLGEIIPYHWGWGAVLWWLSLLSLAMAALHAMLPHRKRVVMGVGAPIIGIVVVVYYYIRHTHNTM